VIPSNRDPLNPTYYESPKEGRPYRYGEIEGNRPKISIKDVGDVLNN
jgi:hypothetical protein